MEIEMFKKIVAAIACLYCSAVYASGNLADEMAKADVEPTPWEEANLTMAEWWEWQAYLKLRKEKEEQRYRAEQMAREEQQQQLEAAAMALIKTNGLIIPDLGGR